MAAILAAVIILGMATAALAVVSDSGTTNCGPHYQRVRAYYYGEVKLYPAPSGYRSAIHWGSWDTLSTYATGPGGGFWQVTSSGGLDDPGTYATCHNIIP